MSICLHRVHLSTGLHHVHLSHELKLATMALRQLCLSSKPCCCLHIAYCSLDVLVPGSCQFCFANHSSVAKSCHCTHAAAATYCTCCGLPKALGHLSYTPECVLCHLLLLHCMELTSSKAAQCDCCDYNTIPRQSLRLALLETPDYMLRAQALPICPSVC